MDGWTIAVIVMGLILAFAGGYIKKLMGEIKELFAVIETALEDKKITKEELSQIVKEAKDVKDAALEIADLIARRKTS